MNPATIALVAADTAPIVRVLLALGVVLVVGRLVGKLFVKLGQPIVIGEIVAGIALGPSLLGLLPGELHERLFPPEILPYLTIVSKIGIVLFMFVVGLELDMSVVRRSGGRAVVISLSSIMMPFLLGAVVLSPMLFDRYPPATGADGSRIDLAPFALFVGVSMCGTAFAILARILAERDMFKIPIGAMLVACAAIDDVVVFTLLAVTTAVAGGSGLGGVVITLGQLALIAAVLIVVVRPIIERLVLRPYSTSGRLGAEQLAIIFTFLMLTAWATAQIGVSELIGAFLFGAILPRETLRGGQEGGLFLAITNRIEGVSVQLLLPVFFVVAGQSVLISGLGAGDVLPALAILAAAFLGKFGGGSISARLTGVPRRQALAVGTMMNTRGLAELVILGVALESGVISTQVYTMLVIMAVVSTVAAGPLLRVVYPDRALRRDIAEAERAGGVTDRAMVVVDEPQSAGPLVDLAVAYGGARSTASITLVHFVPVDIGFAGVTDALAELRAPQERCRAAGVPCNVICRPSARPVDDLVAEVRRVLPDVVVVAGQRPEVVTAITTEGADVVMLDGDLDTAAGIATPGGSGADRRAALEVAVRLALHDDVVVDVGAPSARVARQLRQLGVRLGSGAARVTGRDGDGVVRVAAGDRDRASLYDRLGPWRVGEVVTPLSSR